MPKKRDRDSVDEKVLAPLNPVKLYRLSVSHSFDAVCELHAMRSRDVLSKAVTEGRRIVKGSPTVRSRRSAEEIAAIVGAVFREGGITDAARALGLTITQVSRALQVAGVTDYPRVGRAESARRLRAVQRRNAFERGNP
ncbi:DNA-binding phage protein [Methylobacterium sp. PvP062]|nr:hypothetical protein AU375_02317 [Methylobacterium radiotolerans]